MASVLRYWISTSKHNSIGSLLSINPSCIAVFSAAASTNSNECVGRN